MRWGQDRERHLLQHGPNKPRKEVPTLEAFAPRFIDDYAVANRQKPSGIAAKRTILKLHPVGTMGAKRLDAIDVIERVLCTIRLVRAPRPSMGFYDFDECERVLDVAEDLGATAHLVVLGGEAGLRCGEMVETVWRHSGDDATAAR